MHNKHDITYCNYLKYLKFKYILGTLLQDSMTDRSNAVVKSKYFFSLP